MGYDKSEDIGEKYAIHFLPTKYLIDREGKIIGKVDDETLDAKLKEIFGF
jgi:sporulation protein YlmC with PRC-barrel domain